MLPKALSNLLYKSARFSLQALNTLISLPHGKELVTLTIASFSPVLAAAFEVSDAAYSLKQTVNAFTPTQWEIRANATSSTAIAYAQLNIDVPSYSSEAVDIFKAANSAFQDYLHSGCPAVTSIPSEVQAIPDLVASYGMGIRPSKYDAYKFYENVVQLYSAGNQNIIDCFKKRLEAKLAPMFFPGLSRVAATQAKTIASLKDQLIFQWNQVDNLERRVDGLLDQLNTSNTLKWVYFGLMAGVAAGALAATVTTCLYKRKYNHAAKQLAALRGDSNETTPINQRPPIGQPVMAQPVSYYTQSRFPA